MVVTKSKKTEMLTALQAEFKASKSVFFSTYSGLPVSDLSKMRNELHDAGADMIVAKKTLARKAAQEIGIEDIPEGSLPGPIAFVFAKEDEIAPAKVIAKWVKAKKDLVSFTGAIFEGKLLSKEETIAISSIPSREELLAKLLGSMQAPLSRFVRSLKSPISGFTNVCRELSKKGS